ncbi:MAG: helix-turn-helix domain-containing protein [Acidimicrobiales bacterium]
MTAPTEVTVTGLAYWASHVDQLVPLLAASASPVIPDPSGQAPSADDVLHLTRPQDWASSRRELRDALVFAAGGAGPAVAPGSGSAAGAVAPVENRLVYTVEEAASLLGISRSFAYEAVQHGDIPSMRIGKRILVPKAALERLLEVAPERPSRE